MNKYKQACRVCCFLGVMFLQACGGEYSGSVESTHPTQQAPEVAPQLSISRDKNDQIILNWNEQVGAHNYTLYFSLSEEFRDDETNALILDEPPYILAEEYLDKKYVQLRSNWLDKQSPVSNKLFLGALPDDNPLDSPLSNSLNPPQLTSIVTLNETITLVWANIDGADKYTLFKGLHNVIQNASEIDDVTSPYDDSEVILDQKYYYWLAASNSSQVSELSNITSAIIAADEPVPPINYLIPTVVAISPQSDLNNINVNFRKVEVTFSRNMDGSTISTDTFRVLYAGGESVIGSVSYDDINLVASFTAEKNWISNVTYSVELTTEIKSVEGLSIADKYTSRFITELPQLSLIYENVSEIDDNVSLSFSLDKPSGTPVTLDYRTIDGTAVQNGNTGDYVQENASISFAIGETTKSVLIALNDDKTYEGDEIFRIKLSNAQGVIIENSQFYITIADNESIPELSIADAVINEALLKVTLVASLNHASAFPVGFRFEDGNFVGANGATNSATADDDYRLQPDTLTIPAGRVDARFTIAIVRDNLSENDEVFVVNILSATGANIVKPSAQVIIEDDNGLPNVSLPSNVNINENDGRIEIPVSLSTASSQIIVVDYFTSNDTAIAGMNNDYIAASGQIIFLAGETVQFITLDINADNLSERAESFNLSIENAANTQGEIAANIVDPNNRSLITIAKNGQPPVLSFVSTKLSVVEGAENVSVEIKLSEASGQNITVAYSTIDGSAESGKDYVDTKGTVVFAPGDTTSTVLIPLFDFEIYEGDEIFYLNLESESDVVIDTAKIEITIIENEGKPVISVESIVVDEAIEGVIVTVSIQPSTEQVVTVEYQTMDDSAIAASTASRDYYAKSGVITFDDVNQSTQSIAIIVVDDNLYELDEQFYLTLSNASANASILPDKSQATITIKDSDPKPIVSIISTIAVQENEGTAFVKVSLNTESGVETNVKYTSINNTAIALNDFKPVNLKYLYIPAGSLTGEIPVVIYDDTLFENNEQFYLALTNPVNASIDPLTSQATVTIISDDLIPPILSIRDVTVQEGDSFVDIEVSLNETSGLPTSFSFVTADSTAVAPTDYIARQNAVRIIDAGQLTEIIRIEIVDDTVIENSIEQFYLQVFDVINATLANNSSLITINDDDNLLRPPDLSLINGDGKVRLNWSEVSGANSYNVYYALESGVSPDNYSAMGGTLLLNQSSGMILDNLRLWVNYYFVLTSVAGTVESLPGIEKSIRTMIIPTRPLNDTGISYGAEMLEGINQDCAGVSINQQDCSTGRDLTHPDNSDGYAGLSYSKLDSTGAKITASANNWACVKDNFNGLIWEVKEAANSGTFRDSNWTYSWLNTTGINSGENNGVLNNNAGTCFDAVNCDTEKYIAQVNLINLCGYNDWRLPDTTELFGLVSLSWSTINMKIDNRFFPNTSTLYYWTSSPNADLSGGAWSVNFPNGKLVAEYSRSQALSVRLVRGE